MISDKYLLNHCGDDAVLYVLQRVSVWRTYQNMSLDRITTDSHANDVSLSQMSGFLNVSVCHQLKKRAFSKLYSTRHGCFFVYWTILCECDWKLNNQFVFWTRAFIFVINMKWICIVREVRQCSPVRCVKDVTLTIREGTGLFSRSGNRTLVRENAPR